MAFAKLPSPYYRVSIKALIFDNRQRLLVVKGQGSKWEVPGGGWEHGESMQHCLRRELMEELMVGIRDIDFSTIYPWTGVHQKYGMMLKLAVFAELEDYEITAADSITEYRFVTKQELAELDLHDGELGIRTHIDRIWRERFHGGKPVQ